MPFLVYIIIAISGAGALSGVNDRPMTDGEIITMVRDCNISGLELNAVTSITGVQRKIPLSVGGSQPDGLVQFLTEKEKLIQQNRLAQVYDVKVYDAWCQASDKHGYSGKRSYFKPALEHTALIDQLRTCRRAKNIDNKVPADEYATLTVGNLSLQPTKVTCGKTMDNSLL